MRCPVYPSPPQLECVSREGRDIPVLISALFPGSRAVAGLW